MLRLQATSVSAPPFATNARGKVKNLDADTVDGLDSAALVNPTTRYFQGTDDESDSDFDAVLPTTSPGTYDVSYHVVLDGGGDATYCQIAQIDSFEELLHQLGEFRTTMDSPDLTGRGFAVLAKGDRLEVQCHSNGLFAIRDAAPLQVFLTRVPTVAVTTLHTSS